MWLSHKTDFKNSERIVVRRFSLSRTKDLIVFSHKVVTIFSEVNLKVPITLSQKITKEVVILQAAESENENGHATIKISIAVVILN